MCEVGKSLGRETSWQGNAIVGKHLAGKCVVSKCRAEKHPGIHYLSFNSQPFGSGFGFVGEVSFQAFKVRKCKYLGKTVYDLLSNFSVA